MSPTDPKAQNTLSNFVGANADISPVLMEKESKYPQTTNLANWGLEKGSDLPNTFIEGFGDSSFNVSITNDKDSDSAS